MSKSRPRSDEYAKTPKTQELKPENFVQDQTSGLGQIQQTSQIGIRGIRWRGYFDGQPDGVLNGDIWYDTKSKNLKVYKSGLYDGSELKEWVVEGLYAKGEYVLELGLLYVKINGDGNSVVPPSSDPTQRQRTLFINEGVPYNTNFYTGVRDQNISPFQAIPTNINTNFELIPYQYSDDRMYDGNGDAVVLSTGLHQIITKVYWNLMRSDVNIRQGYKINGNIAETDYMPGIGISATSTSNSVSSGGITTTTTTTTSINYTSNPRTTTTVHYALLKEGDVIQGWCRHNYVNPLDIQPTLYLVQIQ